MPALRSLLATLITRLEVDMATKAVEIDLAIPARMTENALCLEDKSFQRSVFQAQPLIRLESADCRYHKRGRYPCYTCQRRRAA